MAKHHLVRTGQTAALCVTAGRGTYDPDTDVLVPELEASSPEGRYFNCVDCDYVLHDGRRHVEPIEGYVLPEETT